jgi:hypothetical protein
LIVGCKETVEASVTDQSPVLQPVLHHESGSVAVIQGGQVFDLALPQAT